MSNLNQTIKELYQGSISDGETQLVKDNLLGFFKLLQEIDTRLQREQAQEMLPIKKSKINKKTNEYK